jgi:hypothetical protein
MEPFFLGVAALLGECRAAIDLLMTEFSVSRAHSALNSTGSDEEGIQIMWCGCVTA